MVLSDFIVFAVLHIFLNDTQISIHLINNMIPKLVGLNRL